MVNKRVDARSMFFEAGTLNGIPMIGTGTILEHETIPEGYYCYDVYAPEECPDMQHSVILRDLSNHANESIILTEPLDFQGKAELSMENLILDEDSPLLTLEEFQEQNQEMDLHWSLSM